MTLRSPQVCHAAGITYRQLDYWVRIDLLRPVNAAVGSGSRRLFAIREAQIAWVLARISRLAGGLHDLDVLRDTPEWSGWLVVTADGVHHVRNGDELALFPAAIVVDLECCPIGARAVPEAMSA
jgi:hypothetical protein